MVFRGGVEGFMLGRGVIEWGVLLYFLFININIDIQ